MNFKTLFIIFLVLVAAAPISAGEKKNQSERGMLERMEAVPCGAKQRGFTGLGSLWASAGITHVNSEEKLCPQYLLRTDEMEYEIRPNGKHPVILPIGQEGAFKIKKNEMFLKIVDGDRKTREFQIVSIKPTNPDDDAQKTSSTSRD